MRKQFGTFVVLAACSAAAPAQSGVAAYGSLDQYFGYIRSSSGAQVSGLNDGTLLRSRLGVRGGEALGPGYRLSFTLEQGLNADSGSAADGARLFDRQSWVGVDTPYGEWRLGRQNAEIQQIGAAIDYTERNTFGSVVNNFGAPSRYDDDISYKTPRVAGLQGALHYALAERGRAGRGRGAVYQMALDYASAPYRIGYAGLAAKPGSGGTVGAKVLHHNLYADYDYGRGKVYLAYVRSNNVTAGAAGLTAAAILSNTGTPNNGFAGTDPNARRYFNVLQASADYRLGARLRVGALYGVIRDTSGGGAGARGGNAGAFYDLSMRTMLYGFASYLHNDGNAGFRFSGSGAPSANLAGFDVNGKSLTGLQSGIVHRF